MEPGSKWTQGLSAPRAEVSLGPDWALRPNKQEIIILHSIILTVITVECVEGQPDLQGVHIRGNGERVNDNIDDQQQGSDQATPTKKKICNFT